MTDRELIEYAAEAIGLDGRWNEAFQWIDLNDSHAKGKARTAWNPLADDGDALRLAVKLGIGISFQAKESYTGDPNVVVARHWDCGEIDEHFDDRANPEAATRRAVVRAAVAIGVK